MTFTSNFRQEREPEMEREAERRRRDLVVLVPSPFQGHVTPMLQLGHVLHSKGFSITVAHARCNAPDPSNHPEFSFLGLGENISINLDGIIKASDIGLKGRLETIYDMNENCRVPLQEYLEEKGDVVSCIIYDNLMFFVDQVAALLDLPSIVLRPSSAAYFPVLLHVLEHEDTLSSLPQDPIPEFHPLRYQDMPIVFRQSEEVRRFMLTSNDIRSSVAIIWNTMEDLEHTWLSRLQQRYKVPIFSIGPLHKIAPTSRTTSLIEEDDSCLAWLDDQAPQSVIFLSVCGSLAAIDETGFEEIASGLADSNQPFLWAIQPSSIEGLEEKERLIEDFEKRNRNRGRVVKWAPQKKVLAHGSVGGFWSHCGWNSTLESLGEGVPMICRPHFADQLVNARLLIQEWKVGLELEKVERGVIAETIRRLMVGDERKELKKNVMDMKRKLDDSFQKDEGTSNKAVNELTNFISSLSLKFPL
ncbi:unnamed protein product [Cuscuta epithymum]|uniref:UDP-glucose iridoid glucosyltransferase-like n=1 Tax=Cuscuta epithymum TaxID=186058 RepID=A0AAV0DD59_9ASTE|nr:unnamed protein product [Cuscuta epithymum]